MSDTQTIYDNGVLAVTYDRKRGIWTLRTFNSEPAIVLSMADMVALLNAFGSQAGGDLIIYRRVT